MPVAAATVVLAFGVGLALGLLGGGGSVLSVPLLVYVAGWDPHRAATGSLFIVGVTSTIALVAHARAGRVRVRTGLVFGAAGMVGAYTGGRLAGLVPGWILLISFAVLMLLASAGMIRGRRDNGATREELRLAPAVALGAAVGAATGFVGAGGGFIIVPALVLVARLPMPAAVGTSLLVICLQSAAGLAGHLATVQLPWRLTLAITGSAVAGSLIGGRLTGRIPAATLRRAFGYGVGAVALLVLAAELYPPIAASGGQLAAVALVVAVTLAIVIVIAFRPRRNRPNPSTENHPNPQEAVMTDANVTPPTAAEASRPSGMVFTQYYIDCLSQASYLVGDRSTGQAVIVDPRRDVQEYLVDAEAHGLRIVGMINTHFHADFLSGHLELAAATGAWIGYGQVAKAEFETRSLADGERISLGDVVLEIIETPGHTPESISVLVYEHAGDEVAYGVLTGDALFIGDVGRPDLLASIGFTAEQLGVQLYDTIQHKLMGLPDQVRVFPGHGAGSACGKNLSTERQSTIGDQRALNYACQPMSRERFLELVTAGQPSAPEYFVYDAILNRKQREVFDAEATVPALDDAGLEAAIAGGATVLDTRDAATFAAGHLPDAQNVPADGRFAETAGMVLDGDAEIVVIAPGGRQSEVAVRLARIGFDKVVGYVADPDAALFARADDVRRASRLTAAELAGVLAGDGGRTEPVVVDVRNIGEREGGYLPGSLHIPLAELRRRIEEVPTGRPVVVYCAGGWRSSVAASLLRRNGYGDVSDLLGGFAAWQAMNETVTA